MSSDQLLSDQVLTLPSGRRLAWCEWGDRNGRPIVLLHRGPGSRRFCPDPAFTVAARARLITVDRPGYGGSDPVDAPSLLGFAADLGALLGALGLERVPLIGWSQGGQFALAAAVALGARLRSVVLACTPAPEESVPWVPEAGRPLVAAIRARGAAALPEAEAAMGWYASAPEALVASGPGPGDDAARARPGVTAALEAMYREGARQGARGLAGDVVAAHSPWGFVPADVRVPVRLFYGAEDREIATAHGRWYAAALPAATLEVVSGAGHLLPVLNWQTLVCGGFAE